MRHHHANYGFTLVELLIVMVIIGISLRMVPPMMSNMLTKVDLDIAGHHLQGALQTTKLLAVENGDSFKLCAVSGASESSSHKKLALVIKSKDNVVAKQYKSLSSRVKVYWRGRVWHDKCVVFSASGYAVGSQGTFDLKTLAEQYHSQVIVSPSGRIRTVRVMV